MLNYSPPSCAISSSLYRMQQLAHKGPYYLLSGNTDEMLTLFIKVRELIPTAVKRLNVASGNFAFF